jgi:hypothetical protein
MGTLSFSAMPNRHVARSRLGCANAGGAAPSAPGCAATEEYMIVLSVPRRSRYELRCAARSTTSVPTACFKCDRRAITERFENRTKQKWRRRNIALVGRERAPICPSSQPPMTERAFAAHLGGFHEH